MHCTSGDGFLTIPRACFFVLGEIKPKAGCEPAFGKKGNSDVFDYNKKNSGLPIVTQSGATVGYVRGKAFYRKFDPDKHLLLTPEKALALDLKILKQLTDAGAEKLIFFTKSGERYFSTLNHFLEHSTPFNYGWGEQRALPLAGFTRQVSGVALQLTLELGEVM